MIHVGQGEAIGDFNIKARNVDVTCVHVPVTVNRSGQCRISYV